MITNTLEGKVKNKLNVIFRELEIVIEESQRIHGIRDRILEALVLLEEEEEEEEEN